MGIDRTTARAACLRKICRAHCKNFEGDIPTESAALIFKKITNLQRSSFYELLKEIKEMRLGTTRGGIINFFDDRMDAEEKNFNHETKRYLSEQYASFLEKAAVFGWSVFSTDDMVLEENTAKVKK